MKTYKDSLVIGKEASQSRGQPLTISRILYISVTDRTLGPGLVAKSVMAMWEPWKKPDQRYEWIWDGA